MYAHAHTMAHTYAAAAIRWQQQQPAFSFRYRIGVKLNTISDLNAYTRTSHFKVQNTNTHNNKIIEMNQLVCRCCLLENPPITYSIFDTHASYELQQCVPKVHMERHDGLPEVICNQCWLALQEAVHFRRRCEASDRELRRRYEDTNRAIDEALESGLVDQIEQQVNGGGAGGGVEASIDPKQSEQALILFDHQDFAELEMSMLEDLFMDDMSFSSLSDATSTTIEDNSNSILNELLSTALTDPMVQCDRIFQSVSENGIADAALSSSSSLKSGSIWSGTSSPSTSSTPSSPGILSNLSAGTSSTLTVPRIASSSGISSGASASNDSSSSSTPTRQEHALVSAQAGAQSRQSPKANQACRRCPHCDKTFTRNFQLSLHLTSVHNIGERSPYKCKECSRTFASSPSLKYHIKAMHSQERPFACMQCEKRFVLRSQLQSHMHIHSGELKPRRFKCEHCQKAWPTKSDLRTHMRTHNPHEVRPFQCDQCEKRFHTRGHLASHQLVHSGEKPFACSYCSKSYQSVGNLNHHIARRHRLALTA